jgi:exosortase/archaeosortase family protein
MFINKNLLRYLLKFILSFCFLYYGTKAIIGLASPGGYYAAFINEYLNYVKWFRYALLYSAKALLSISGYKVFVQNMYTLRMYNGHGVHLVYSCLGFGILSFWAAFIFANKTNWRKKIIWIVGGWAMISFINVIRLSLLLISANEKKATTLNIDNHTLFNIAAYLLVFVMIYLFDRSQKKSGEESIKKHSVETISPPKKKILIMIEWFTPGYKAGGPIRSCSNIAFALKEEYDIYVLTTDTDHGETKPYDTVPSNKWTNAIDPLINVYYAKKATLKWKQLFTEIAGVQPDYIYLNNIFSPQFVLYPLWLKYQKKIKAKIILCPRGTLYDSALALKSYKKKPFLSLLKWTKVYKHILFHATGEREKKAILKYFPGSNVLIADNLPDIIQPDFYNCEKKPGILKCIFIARIMSIKNTLFFLAILEQVKAEVYFTIVGPVEDAAYWEECMQQIKKLPGNIKVDYIGPKRHEELAGLLQQHHLFVLPTTGENFGHAIFEALLAGRPVLISDQTPWLNLTDSNAGWDIPLNDPDGFKAVIEQAASWDQYEFDKHALSAWRYAKNNINAREYKKQYFKLFS